MTETIPSAAPIELALLQILMSAKVVESKVMEVHLERLRVDFPDQVPDLKVTDIFKGLNQKLKKLSLEIKTVVMRKAKHMLVEGAGEGEINEEDEDEEDESEQRRRQQQQKQQEEKENSPVSEDDANMDISTPQAAAASSSRTRTRPLEMINFHCIANCSDDYTSVQFGSALSDVEFEVLREIIGMLGE